DAGRGRAIVSDGERPARLVAFDLGSGDRSVVCDDSGLHGRGPTLIEITGLVLDSAHDLFVATDAERKGVVVIDPSTFVRAIVGGSGNAPPAGTIAFVSNRDGNDEIYVMNGDGSAQKRLTDNPANDESPAWSPDHARIAFTSDRDGNNEIYVMN